MGFLSRYCHESTILYQLGFSHDFISSSVQYVTNEPVGNISVFELLLRLNGNVGMCFESGILASILKNPRMAFGCNVFL